LLHANHKTLLVVTLIGVTACDRTAPTAAPSTPSVPTPEFVVVPASLGMALQGLDAAQRRRFEMGRGVFATVFTPETGLGPLFNSVGCANCHEVPVVGGSGSNDPEEGGEDVELHATAFHGAGARCDDLAAAGGQVIQKTDHARLQRFPADDCGADPARPPTPAIARHPMCSDSGCSTQCPTR